MAEFRKHIGRLDNTGRRVVVIFMQHPDMRDKSLVVDTDGLPERFADALIDVVNSTEGQNTVDLYEVLHRRLYPETGRSILVELGANKLMQVVPCSMVTMLPKESLPVSLIDVLKQLKRWDASSEPQPLEVIEDHFNPHEHNNKTTRSEEQLAVAKGLVVQADMIEDEALNIARTKREQAYRMYPELRPATAAMPGDSIESLKAKISSLLEENAVLRAKATAPKAVKAQKELAATATKAKPGPKPKAKIESVTATPTKRGRKAAA
jgi:hypothetical protein